MTVKKLIPSVLMAGALIATIPACKHKPTDAEVLTSVKTAIAQYPGISADVKDGVVTLNGSVNSATDKANIESSVNALSKQGVQSLTDNITIAPPPPPPPVATSPDDALKTGVADAVKDFPSVSATVNNGVIAVTGTIEKSKWVILKQALDALHPQKVDPKGLTIK